MSTTTEIHKLCRKCGKDVTHSLRMKDSKGNYWCPDCGSADEAKKGSGLISPCPKCQRPTHASQFVRHNNQYVCEHCAGLNKSPGDGPAGPSAEAKKQKRNLIVAIVTLAGAALVLVYTMGLLGD